MRGRNKPWANDFIKAHDELIYKKENFDKLTLEIGIGKGDFIIQNAKYNNDYHHIGVEMNTSIFAMAMKKIVNEGLTNVSLLNMSANKLLEYVNPNSISKLYLNFSDPWPQNGYRKRRLVHPVFLAIFETLLVDNGMIYFKTDNKGLFDFGIEHFKARNYILESVDYDYQTVEGDFISEYEAKFRSLGQPIYRAVINVDKSILKPFKVDKKQVETNI